MCVNCGCGNSNKGHRHETQGRPVSPGQFRNSHHSHSHGESESSETRRIFLEMDILDRNDRLADENRIFFREKGVLSLNLLSGPGAGKTTLIEKTAGALAKRFPLMVIEGDQATSRDADRIRQKGIPAIQINTGQGCHLDAHMVGHASEELPLVSGGVLFIENVGNLVCPALFDLGESARVVLFSVTEGEDKPLKYPGMFQWADLVLLTKTDLLPYLDFDRDTAVNYIRAMNPDVTIHLLSSKTGEGLEGWIGWIDERRIRADETSARTDA